MGRGARAGLIMAGALAVLLALVGVAAALLFRTHGRAVDFAALRPGDCFNREVVEGSLVSVRVVPCSAGHRHEAFAVVRYPAAPGVPFPGPEAIRAEASTACGGPLSDYLADIALPVGVQFGFLFPEEHRWAQGERAIVCDLFATGAGARHRSVRSA